MNKEKYKTSWYQNRNFVVVEIPFVEDIDFIQEIFNKKNIKYDYRGLSDNNNNVFILFKDNFQEAQNHDNHL